MLTFFRRIRKGLLQGGATRKYLLYALGEIALVVIGILIALQINNWNEERKNNSIKIAYKKALIEDLSKDITEAKSKIVEMKEELNKLLAIGEKISKALNFDSIIHVYRLELSPLFNATTNFNRNTYDGLLATGNINLIDKDLHNSLMRLHDLQERTIQKIDVNLSFYMNYATRTNLPFNDELSAVGGEALERIWTDIDRVEFLRDFISKLTSKTLAYKLIIKDREELLSVTESVLKRLDE